MIRFDFGFLSKSGLTLYLYYAIKYIQKEGYWVLTDEVENLSRIKFMVSRDELYKIQLKNSSLDSFIKVVMRLYTSLFSQYVPVDEESIAKMSRNSKANVVSNLITLSKMRVIDYIPYSKSPLLILNQERYDNKNLVFSMKRYQENRGSFEKRVEKIIDYASQRERCRSSLLLEYFGEESKSGCGICDICMKIKRENDATYSDNLKKRIVSFLEESPRNLEEIRELTGDESDNHIDILRDLIDRGAVVKQ